MALSHETGPHLAYGPNGPSLAWGGFAMYDPRNGYQPGQDVTVPVLGWLGNGVPQLFQAPAALSAVNIAALQVPVAGTPLALVSATGAGITAGASVTNIATGQRVTGLLGIDGASGTIAFGQDGTCQTYDPRTLLARNIRITSVGVDTGATATIRGFDIYGQPMSETQTLTSGSVTAGKKAFGYIQSVTPAGTLSGSNISVGTGDVIGFPLRVIEFSLVTIAYGGPPALVITASTGFTAADATTPTATTGDVRGTYALQSPSDGTKLLTMFVRVLPHNLAAIGGVYSGLFGLVNFTN